MTDSSSQTLFTPKVQAILDRLHALSDEKDPEVIRHLISTGYDWWNGTAEQNAHMFRDAPLAVTKEAGMFLYVLARGMSAKYIVEFGTSLGISTIYLAAAVRDNGGGTVVTTEIEPGKIAKAKEYIAEAGLSEYVELREGDARETLRETDSIDLLFFDGWKDLYLDLLKITMNKVRRGGLVLADDLEANPDVIAPYLEFVRNPANGFASVMIPMSEGRELSVKL